MSSQGSAKDAQPTKPDSSYRKWFVLMSGFFIIFLCTGFPFNMAVLNPELLRTFEKSKAETALVQSITIGVLYIAGALCGKIVAKYGARVTGITGSIVTTLGLVFSFFAESIPHLIVTLGIVSGFGFSATFISAFTTVGEYFEGKSKLMALSFLSFGSGCGSIVIPYLLHFLIEEFGWRGCLLIFGGLFANMICFFAVCKPLSIGISQNTSKKSKDFDPESTSNEDGFTKSIRSLVTSKVYLTYTVAMCFTLPVINSLMVFIIDFLTTNGFESDTRIQLYLYLQLGNALCRFVPGLCKKYIPHTSVLIIPACFTVLGSTAIALLPHADTYIHYIILLVCLGMALGVGVTTVPMTTMKLVGLQKYSAGLGVLMTLMGISNCIAGPIAGLFVDLTGSYTKPFYCMSGGLGFATGMFLLASWLKRKSTTNHSGIEINTSVIEVNDNPTFTP
ncbi:monocarboxylate transporter 6-like isoform X1 [Mizuhopecten yessoensis]|nr:monocarboxylate transporter 6-like isoform X1 [Mizuhopecten yessoensis]XP_021354112.1 monocarboxylate transporter 6-like isoform X1 [Mizuhopecten yessoensis]